MKLRPSKWSPRVLMHVFVALGLAVGAGGVLQPARAATVEYIMGPDGLVIANVDATCPMIYDNDWWSDTPDKNYLWAKASLGRADLRGNIVTRDMWDWQKGYLYTMRRGMDDAVKSIGMARRSGLKNIPDPVPGCDRVFTRPRSGKIEDTSIVPSNGSDLIVAEARKASPDKPLLIFVGGPLNTVANACLIDPSITKNMVVFMTDLRGYNGKDPWANYIVAKRCKLVNYGAHIWWPQRPEPPVMPMDRFEELPKNEMTQDVHRIAKAFWERSTRSDKPDRDDGFADGAPVFLVFEPKTWQGAQRQKIDGVFDVRDVQSTSFDLLDARELDYGLMSEAFFSVLKDPAVYGRSGLAVAFGLPRTVALNAYMSRGLVVEAVYEATRLSGGGEAGRVVNTGTLEVDARGVRYRRNPTDRLILQLEDQLHEFVVKEAQGSATAVSAAAWLVAPHKLTYTHRVPGKAEGQMSVQFDGIRFDVNMQGWTMLGQERYTVDLTASGQSAAIWDMHGRQIRTEYDLKGTLAGYQIEIDVNERHVFNMAAATSLRLLYSMRGSASRFDGTLNSLLRVGGHAYKFDAVRIQTDVRERGGQGAMSVIGASGQISRDGQRFGHCDLEAGRVVLRTGEGPIELDMPLDGS